MKKNRIMQIDKDIVPLSLFKIQASKILHSIEGSNRFVVITQNGKAAAVVISPEEFDKYREREAFVEAVHGGLDDVERNAIVGTKEVEKFFDQRFGKLK